MAPTTKNQVALSLDLIENRVDRLRSQLGCLGQERDPQGSEFWYLRLGTDELEIPNTRPIAIGFDNRLNDLTETEIKDFLTAKDSEIYRHYLARTGAEQPVMYLLYPTSEESGQAVLDNPTFRGMRQSLMSTFDDLYILDLHGNSKKKEKCPDGSKDENIFDIQQGVSVCFFIKRLNGEQDKTNVYHADLYGKRDLKYGWLEKHDLSTTEWKKVEPQSPFYLFIPQNNDLLPEYNRGWKVTDIFPVNSVGIVTGQDSRTIAIKKADAELLAKGHNLSASTVTPILYRPFDTRYIVYDPSVVTRSREQVMRQMLTGDNLGLVSSRQQSQSGEWALCGVTNTIIESCSISNKTREINSLFPLYLYPTTQAEKDMGITRKPNIAPEFLAKLEQNLGYIPTPEDIFNYIYAIFHSPTYRSRYAEFLKGDFPRVPLTRNVDLFRQLGELGEQLVNSHLMKYPILNQKLSRFSNNGGGCIVDAGHPKYENGKVVINKQKDGFMDVPEAVWNFHVGGYQVCHKWLKDRKGRTLSQDDIGHYQKIVVALGQSIDLMAKIDAAIPNWPIDAEYN